MNIGGPVRVLSVCDDGGLRSSRELLLQAYGYEVESHPSDDYLLMVHVSSFDVAIICQSVNRDEAPRLMRMLRRYNPRLRILDLSRPVELDSAGYCEPGPHIFLEAVKSLVGGGIRLPSPRAIVGNK
jgi:hypothetical protein